MFFFAEIEMVTGSDARATRSTKAALVNAASNQPRIPARSADRRRVMDRLRLCWSPQRGLLIGIAALSAADHLWLKSRQIAELSLHGCRGRIVSVCDETTIDITWINRADAPSTRVRIAGIAPIAGSAPASDGTPASEAAMLQLAQRAVGREAEILLDPRINPTSRGGELTAHVRLDEDGGALLGEQLIRDGVARAAAEGVYSLRYATAERRARRSAIGLWGGDPAADRSGA